MTAAVAVVILSAGALLLGIVAYVRLTSKMKSAPVFMSENRLFVALCLVLLHAPYAMTTGYYYPIFRAETLLDDVTG